MMSLQDIPGLHVIPQKESMTYSIHDEFFHESASQFFGQLQVDATQDLAVSGQPILSPRPSQRLEQTREQRYSKMRNVDKRPQSPWDKEQDGPSVCAVSWDFPNQDPSHVDALSRSSSITHSQDGCNIEGGPCMEGATRSDAAGATHAVTNSLHPMSLSSKGSALSVRLANTKHRNVCVHSGLGDHARD
jgi:hypothetical protein